jgi:hypothetical protein
VTVKISAKLSDKDRPDANGLEAIKDDLLADVHKSRHGRWVAVVELDLLRISTEVKKGGERHPTVEITSIEVMLGDNADAASKMKQATYEARTGHVTIPGIDAQPSGGQPDAELLDDEPALVPAAAFTPPRDEWLGDK